MPASHFEAALRGISTVLREHQIDIALLQEVDFNSSRSHHQNQLDLLAEQSGLTHRAPLITWTCPYVPYPGLEPRTHFGSVCSGGGILSRFPIQPLRTELLPKPGENSLIYNFFYLHRFLQIVETGGLKICNLHLEAFSKTNRALHLEHLARRLEKDQIDLAAGDFNGEISLPETLRGRFEECVQGAPTFPSNHPTDHLDHFIIKKGVCQNRALRVPETGTLSDHLPVLLEAEFEKA
jgi:endonuclease/exonuclease/phosphatase family metal-dependent hydrolase